MVGKKSIHKKLAAIFVTIIFIIMLFSMFLYIRTSEIMRRLTYEKMQEQAEFYQSSFDTEFNNILRLQIDFFTNQKLVFLTGDKVLEDDYERREALLSVQERIETISRMSNLVKDSVLFMPKIGYKVTPSTIRQMDEEDFQRMEKYISQSNEQYLNYDGQDFYFLRTSNFGEELEFIFIITLSESQITKHLALLNSFERGGAFIYNEQENVMIESSSAECMGCEIFNQLQMNQDNEYIPVQKVRAGGNTYLVSVGKNSGIGIFVQYVEEGQVMEYSRYLLVYMMFFLLVMVCLSAMFVTYTRRIIHRPMQLLIGAFEKVKVGNMQEHIHHTNDDEFYYLYEGFNDMEDQLDRLIQEVYVQKNLVQKAQMKQLQAQINPHFLYNSFFTLSRCIKIGEYEDAEQFTKHLGTYFKFLTRNGTDDITLKQEVEHARSFASIQGLRFEGRIEIRFGELPSIYQNRKVPRLILQPLLENAFEYGLENQIDGGILQVSFGGEGKRLEILVEDSGEEASEEDIERIRQMLVKEDIDEITGLININRRLQNYFKGKAGMTISRSRFGGMEVGLYMEWEDIYEPEFTDC